MFGGVVKCGLYQKFVVLRFIILSIYYTMLLLPLQCKGRNSCLIIIICRYIPVLMAQAKIYWDLENYSQVEKIFRKSVEFCNESDIWKLNVAHVLFMQENKFKEATGFYEPIVKKNYDNVRILMNFQLLLFRDISPGKIRKNLLIDFYYFILLFLAWMPP